MIPGLGRHPWRRKWQPTPVFLPGEPQGQRSLVGYSPWGHKESDTTERFHFQFSKNDCISGYIFSRFSNKCSGSLFSIYLLYLLYQVELSRKTDPVRCLSMYVCMSLSICLFVKERENFLAIGFQD